MGVSWGKMSGEEFTSYGRLLGRKVILVDGISWIQARPFFFRPLLPCCEYAPDSIRAPRSAFFGGFQHAVPSASRSNSFLNFRLADPIRTYSLETLSHHRRWQIKAAAKHFTIRPIDDVNDFNRPAFRVYRSFYERTQYKEGAERRHAEGFSRWAEALFQIPKVLVLGAYRNNTLCGVNVSMLVDDTVVYATFFCHSESLPLNLAGLMLHAVLEGAAGHSEVRRVFAGMCNGERGIDNFYARRGFQLVRKPAALRVNPWAMTILRRAMPKQYSRLLGTSTV